MIRYLTAGESHGPELTGILEGVPSLVLLQKGHCQHGVMTFLEIANYQTQLKKLIIKLQLYYLLILLIVIMNQKI